MKTLILLRGLPGSGKSTLAKIILQIRETDEPEGLSADDFFINENGEYEFDSQKMHLILERCKRLICNYIHLVISQKKSMMHQNSLPLASNGLGCTASPIQLQPEIEHYIQAQ